MANKNTGEMKGAESRGATKRLQEMGHAFKQSGALIAAIEVDLFTHVSQGADTIEAISKKTGLSLWAGTKLVDTCAALGLLIKKGNTYSNAADVERFLVKGKQAYIGPWITGGRDMYDLWKDVAAILTGVKSPRGKGYYEEVWKDVKSARELHEATYSVGLAAGYKLAKTIDLSRSSLLLDLGGGSGCYSIALVSSFPTLKAIVMDYPTVCEVAKQFINEAGLSDRISTFGGDLIKVDYPPRADLMLLSSNLPNFSSRQLEIIINKAYQAMANRGIMIILGEALNDDRIGPLEPVLYSLEEALVGGEGEGHTRAEVNHLLENAGFKQIEIDDFIPEILTKFVAYKE
ncbi:MAG: hypothetical protein HY730_05530 [Candidatus Tectomicrobia bacterium]|uniref:O-methyltransferase C-terminal domain-containing protein n=1 Tax=Tectimicrobiota bacterium TaxID=2528274 RepID=A0A933GLW4_UNCTE|nr:hypothetical protein [Candidatus Tectomicrobia bacterium]